MTNPITANPITWEDQTKNADNSLTKVGKFQSASGEFLTVRITARNEPELLEFTRIAQSKLAPLANDLIGKDQIESLKWIPDESSPTTLPGKIVTKKHGFEERGETFADLETKVKEKGAEKLSKEDSAKWNFFSKFGEVSRRASQIAQTSLGIGFERQPTSQPSATLSNALQPKEPIKQEEQGKPVAPVQEPVVSPKTDESSAKPAPEQNAEVVVNNNQAEQEKVQQPKSQSPKEAPPLPAPKAGSDRDKKQKIEQGKPQSPQEQTAGVAEPALSEPQPSQVAAQPEPVKTPEPDNKQPIQGKATPLLKKSEKGGKLNVQPESHIPVAERQDVRDRVQSQGAQVNREREVREANADVLDIEGDKSLELHEQSVEDTQRKANEKTITSKKSPHVGPPLPKGKKTREAELRAQGDSIFAEHPKATPNPADAAADQAEADQQKGNMQDAEKPKDV